MINFLSLFPTILLVSFGLFAIYAGYSNLKSIRKFRAPRKYAGELLNWSVRPYADFKYEPDTWISINLHRLAIFLTGCVALYVIFFKPVEGIAIPGFSTTLSGLIIYPVLAMCVAGTGFFWGQALFGPLAEFLAGDSHYAVSDEGILNGGYLFPWSTFSHYSINTEQSVIQLWSATFHGAPAFTLIPPSAGELSTLRGILQGQLPSGAADAPGFLRRCAFPALMAMLGITVYVAAILTTSLAFGYAIILIAVFNYLLVFLGVKAIMGLIYGGRHRPAPVE
jgi:hypothetical protein